jgi:surface protein
LIRELKQTDVTGMLGKIGEWDVSKVPNMDKLFEGQTTCDPDISGWDVSRVTSMRSMFEGAQQFNSDISKWETDKVYWMFYGARAFNQALCWPQREQMCGQDKCYVNIFFGPGCPGPAPTPATLPPSIVVSPPASPPVLVSPSRKPTNRARSCWDCSESS